MVNNKRKKVFFLQATGKYGNTFAKVPIWIYEVVIGDLFPIKFEYRQRGYKGLRFTARPSEIIFN